MSPSQYQQIIDRLEDKIDDLALKARQTELPSGVLYEIKDDIKHLLERMIAVEKQTTTTNGRVTNLERWKLILTTAIIVIIATKFPQFSALFHLI